MVAKNFATADIHREVLPNGLTIITEQMDHIRSVSMGIWMKSGSRDEEAETSMASRISSSTWCSRAPPAARRRTLPGRWIPSAATWTPSRRRKRVCFNIKVLDEHLPVAVDVLSDLVLNPVFARSEITRERGVILEEIKMDEDNPDYLVHEIFTQNFWKDHPLGKPILGTKETVRGSTRRRSSSYYRKQVRARRT